MKKENKVHVVEEADDSDSLSDSFYVNMVSEENTNQDNAKCVSSEDSVKSPKWIVPLVANGTIVPFKLDTAFAGCSGSVTLAFFSSGDDDVKNLKKENCSLKPEETLQQEPFEEQVLKIAVEEAAASVQGTVPEMKKQQKSTDSSKKG
ncbi:unnamed protein product [Leuciscus chuanchicus]